MTTFWETHQVGGPYHTIEESLAALDERKRMFPDLERLMPTYLPGLAVLDYGCGPGHDTIQIAASGGFVFYTDTSPLALRYTDERLHVHGFESLAEYWEPFRALLAVDQIHCAGVLHHIKHPSPVLHYFRQVLVPGGEARIMVYDGSLSEHTQSKVPVTHWWTHDEFICLAENCGFDAGYLGSYECSAEWRPNCWAACYRLT